MTSSHRLSAISRLIACVLLSLCLFSSVPVLANDWQELAPGIDYVDVGAHGFTPWSHVHVFRIDLKQYQLDLVMANDLSQPHASANEFAYFSKALLTINGGFFDQNYRPLGLRISNQQQHNPIKRISWWGIFYIQHQKPHLSSLLHYNPSRKIDFAVQSGPRLLINGQIPSLKPGHAERSALGISPDGQVIILVTENAPMTTTSLAELMRLPPLNCKDALNLDGGSSSQLHAHIGSFAINVHGLAHVADAIVVKPRES